MLEASSVGHAPLKNKTINAEVNLLAEWQREKDRLSDQITRFSVIFAMVALVAFASAPLLVHAFADSGHRLQKANNDVQESKTLLGALESAKVGAKPKIDQGRMHDTVTREARQFLGYTFQLVNAGSSEMAFESVNASVIGGEMTIKCRADAENNSVVEAFIQQAGQGSNVKSNVLTSVQKNSKLGPDGVGFEYSKAVEVIQ